MQMKKNGTQCCRRKGRKASLAGQDKHILEEKPQVFNYGTAELLDTTDWDLTNHIPVNSLVSLFLPGRFPVYA